MRILMPQLLFCRHRVLFGIFGSTAKRCLSSHDDLEIRQYDSLRARQEAQDLPPFTDRSVRFQVQCIVNSADATGILTSRLALVTLLPGFGYASSRLSSPSCAGIVPRAC